MTAHRRLSRDISLTGESQDPVSVPYCPVCSSTEVGLIGSLPDRYWFGGVYLERPLRGGELLWCENCLLKFRFPVYDQDFYASLYNNCITTNWQEESGREDWARILEFLRREVRADARVLDFGCNTGGLLARMDQNYRRYGLEINESAAEIAAIKSGAKIWSSIQDIPTGARFDAIVLSDVVEHVTNPKELITDLIELLEKDGILIITTGDAGNKLWERFGSNWWYCVFPEHVSFISRAWLDYLSESVQLKVVRYERFSYCTLSPLRRMLDTILMYIYGLTPGLYIGLVRLLKATLRRSGDIPVRGVGVSADHIFVALSRKNCL